jgi:hypothetical protein
MEPEDRREEPIDRPIDATFEPVEGLLEDGGGFRIFPRPIGALLDLFLRPSRLFAGIGGAPNTALYCLAAWTIGVAQAYDKFEMRATAGRAPGFIDSWPFTWLALAGSGVLFAWFYVRLGGW